MCIYEDGVGARHGGDVMHGWLLDGVKDDTLKCNGIRVLESSFSGESSIA